MDLQESQLEQKYLAKTLTVMTSSDIPNYQTFPTPFDTLKSDGIIDDKSADGLLRVYLLLFSNQSTPTIRLVEALGQDGVAWPNLSVRLPGKKTHVSQRRSRHSTAGSKRRLLA